MHNNTGCSVILIRPLLRLRADGAMLTIARLQNRLIGLFFNSRHFDLSYRKRAGVADNVSQQAFGFTKSVHECDLKCDQTSNKPKVVNHLHA